MKPNNISWGKQKGLFVGIFLGAIVLSAMQIYSAKNFPDPNSPYYAGQYAANPLEPIEAITVVSYNIWFGEDIDQALSELKEFNSQQPVDVILLQEMDETGTEQLARGLQMNYVYYPAAVEPTYGKNFGNAILSRWPITDSRKLILPHISLSNRMNRTATRAAIRVHDIDILVYSIHTESIFTLPQFREDQYTAVLKDVGLGAEFVIIGGDFNSFTEADVHNMEAAYTQTGFMRASKESGYTVVKFGLKLSTDHIFTKGFVVEEAGTMQAATASDHLPVWTTLKRNN